MNNKLAVIVPVYGDWESLSENIAALKKYTPKFSKLKCKVYFVNDCGPDADDLEDKILHSIRGRKNFYYHRNDQNLGFVKNCNNAVFHIVPQDHDVLLLNSDAVITAGVIKELYTILYIQPTIAAACPRSNAATIFSVPMPNGHNRPLPIEESRNLHKKLIQQIPRYYESPLAHGFCMMIRRDVIDEFGLFDEIYGKGYGEENDFCMRVVSAGHTCAVANRAFVGHYKARSFTEETRIKQVENNEKILNKRYPEFNQLIAEYIGRIDGIEQVIVRYNETNGK